MYWSNHESDFTMTYKNKFPFKVGCTSYVIPDMIVPNVLLMSNIIDDVELLFFESAKGSSFLSNEELKELEIISKNDGISYSIHCPIDICAGLNDKISQERFVFQIEQIIRETETLPVSGFIVHLDGLPAAYNSDEEILWVENVNKICKKISTINKIDTSKICIENLSYNPGLNVEIISKYNFSACIDIGHLWLNKHDWKTYCNCMLPLTKTMHLHGVSHNKDHRSIKENDLTQLTDFIQNYLMYYKQVLTIETFKKDSTFDSLEILGEIWDQLHL
jgi:hypothetical protein